MTDYTYSDIALNFKRHPFTSDVLIKYDVDTVKQALTVLFLTNPYEKRFDPNFGVGISSMMFELLTTVVKTSLLKKIKNQIAYYEPRVVVENIEVQDNPDENSVTVNLYFYVISNPNKLETMTVDINRIR